MGTSERGGECRQGLTENGQRLVKLAICAILFLPDTEELENRRVNIVSTMAITASGGCEGPPHLVYEVSQTSGTSDHEY